MAMITFEDYPSTNTPLNSTNLNNNFNELSLKPVVLYSNDQGDSGDITLSDSSANYSYIEIFFKENGGVYNSVKAYNPDGKRVALISEWTSGNSYVYYKTKTMTFNGTSLYQENEHYNSQVRFGGTNLVEITDQNYISIIRVIGYK